jgi:hypothetical protein
MNEPQRALLAAWEQAAERLRTQPLPPPVRFTVMGEAQKRYWDTVWERYGAPSKPRLSWEADRE